MHALAVIGALVDQRSQPPDVGPNDLLASMLDHSVTDATAAQADEYAAQADMKEQKAISVPVVSGLSYHPDGTSIACHPRLGTRTYLH